MSTKLMTMRTLIRIGSLTVVMAAAGSCGDVVRTGRSPVMLVVDSITPSIVQSSVATGKADTTVATLHVVVKNVDFVTPTTNNSVTITGYHVAYTRADGRNSPGVDVPYEFDGKVTLTIPANSNSGLAFEIVRQVAKSEAPLKQLTTPTLVISTIATVTFFGQDLVGNSMSVTGSTLINFGN
jgi:hypothetical protein